MSTIVVIIRQSYLCRKRCSVYAVIVCFSSIGISRIARGKDRTKTVVLEDYYFHFFPF